MLDLGMEFLEGVLAISYMTNRRMIPRVQLSIAFVGSQANSVRKLNINHSCFKDFSKFKSCIYFPFSFLGRMWGDTGRPFQYTTNASCFTHELIPN